MNYIFKIVFLFLICSTNLLAQQYISIKGKVIDKKSKEPLAFAHITFANNQYGSATNGNGFFTINISPKNFQDTLLFSYMGYESFKLDLNQFKAGQYQRKIELTPASFKLNEIVVKPVDVRYILEKAIRRIPKNYSKSPKILRGFYRESIRDSLSKRYLLFAEGVIDTYKSGVRKTALPDQVKVVKSLQRELDEFYIHNDKKIYLPEITQGSYLGVFLDVVKYNRNLFFLNEKIFNNYWIEYDHYSSINGKKVLVLSFRPKKGSIFYVGKIYLEEESFAIIKVNYHPTQNAIELYNKDAKKRKLNIRLLKRNYEINYFKFGKKWYIQSAHVLSDFNVINIEKIIQAKMDYIVTEVKTKKIRRFNYTELSSSNNAFSTKALKVSDDFWENHNILEVEEIKKNAH